ncbi:MAG: HAMP domain-containing sensor histidine kinase [Lachnospiraceae bacterium]|nr:HAMP domain-containing sensor histidine kinase [Lachnospiraceae bacterium]
MEIFVQLLVAGISAAVCFLTGDIRIICGVLAGCIVCLLLISVVFWRMREKRLEELTLYLMRLQDDMTLPELTKCREGNLGVLQSEIYKLVVLLQERSVGASREKEYLAKMLSDISHQIKTPLTSITILTDLLKNTELSEEKRAEFTGKIDSQVERITWLVRNLLTLSQLDANMLKLKKEEVYARSLLQSACQPFEIMAELKGVQLSVADCGDMKLVCDARWTAEAVSNVVKNCIEHTPRGGQVRVTASQNNFATNIWIEDNGEGIPREELPHIFERFYKGGGHSGESVGIGLAMSKQIVMLQNGMIYAASQEGAGTSFHIKLYSEIIA